MGALVIHFLACLFIFFGGLAVLSFLFVRLRAGSLQVLAWVTLEWSNVDEARTLVACSEVCLGCLGLLGLDRSQGPEGCLYRSGWFLNLAVALPFRSFLLCFLLLCILFVLLQGLEKVHGRAIVGKCFNML